MGLITVEVWDATGNKKRQVEMPDDAPMRRILAVLIEKMSFPQHGPDGQLLSYKCQHRTTGKQLLDDQTLGEVGVQDGDVLRLLPEITAGFGVAGAGCRADVCRSNSSGTRNPEPGTRRQ